MMMSVLMNETEKDFTRGYLGILERHKQAKIKAAEREAKKAAKKKKKSKVVMP